MTRRLFIFGAIVILLLLPCRVWACACCAHPGEYQINLVKPDVFKLSVMERLLLTQCKSVHRRGGSEMLPHQVLLPGATDD